MIASFLAGALTLYVGIAVYVLWHIPDADAHLSKPKMILMAIGWPVVLVDALLKGWRP